MLAVRCTVRPRLTTRRGGDVIDTELGRFRVRCRDCGRTVLTGVMRIGDAEARALYAHVEVCRPDLVEKTGVASAALGTLLARFDVRTAPD
jgi:hypothetical protein